MNERSFGIILDSLAERIEELKLDNYLKEIRIKELEEDLAQAKKGAQHGKN